MQFLTRTRQGMELSRDVREHAMTPSKKCVLTRLKASAFVGDFHAFWLLAMSPPVLEPIDIMKHND